MVMARKWHFSTSGGAANLGGVSGDLCEYRGSGIPLLGITSLFMHKLTGLDITMILSLDFIKDPDSYNAVLGYAITLSCAVEGSPNQMQWQHNSTDVTAGVTTTGGTSSLVIASAKLSSGGEYRCIASYQPTADFIGKIQVADKTWRL